jgi:hypothetical protein
VEKYTPWRREFKPEGEHFVSGNSLSFGGAAKLRWMGGGGAQRPVWRVYELKKTGTRSAAKTLSFK